MVEFRVVVHKMSNVLSEQVRTFADTRSKTQMTPKGVCVAAVNRERCCRGLVPNLLVI